VAYSDKIFKSNGFQGASAPSTEGAKGIVPQPSGPDANRFLRGNGQWADADAPATFGLLTSNNTPTVVWSKTLTAGSLYVFNADIVAFESTTSTIHAAFLRRALVWRNSPGTATLSTLAATGEAGQIVGQDDEDAALVVEFTVSSNDIQLTATGIAATDIDWRFKITWIEQTAGPA